MENKKWQKTTRENNNNKKNYGGHMKKVGNGCIKAQGLCYLFLD